ncbi:hypothetical protein LR48_Vigan05g086100 [Vigna angularis]|uniref:Uncharacterized protein n=1 Tax=Phaseolus angularis TaxID=3914 RepID=A0A0L9UL07_PHAAN|nr:hypothetical protein LR48_Vigan05g086100 [Vigna angularis]
MPYLARGSRPSGLELSVVRLERPGQRSSIRSERAPVLQASKSARPSGLGERSSIASQSARPSGLSERPSFKLQRALVHPASACARPFDRSATKILGHQASIVRPLWRQGLAGRCTESSSENHCRPPSKRSKLMNGVSLLSAWLDGARRVLPRTTVVHPTKIKLAKKSVPPRTTLNLVGLQTKKRPLHKDQTERAVNTAAHQNGNQDERPAIQDGTSAQDGNQDERPAIQDGASAQDGIQETERPPKDGTSAQNNNQETERPPKDGMSARVEHQDRAFTQVEHRGRTSTQVPDPPAWSGEQCWEYEDDRPAWSGEQRPSPYISNFKY